MDAFFLSFFRSLRPNIYIGTAFVVRAARATAECRRQSKAAVGERRKKGNHVLLVVYFETILCLFMQYRSVFLKGIKDKIVLKEVYNILQKSDTFVMEKVNILKIKEIHLSSKVRYGFSRTFKVSFLG